MSGMRGHGWLWWLVVAVVVAFVLSDPAGSGTAVGGAFRDAVTFIQSTVGSATDT